MLTCNEAIREIVRLLNRMEALQKHLLESPLPWKSTMLEDLGETAFGIEKLKASLPELLRIEQEEFSKAHITWARRHKGSENVP